MTALEPVRSSLLHETLQARLKRLIIERHLKPGDLLPTEHELMRALGVSRNSVREAIKALQMLGVVETRHGFGTFVRRASLDPLGESLVFRIRVAEADGLQTVLELLQLRQLIECGLMARVIAAAGPDERARWSGLVDQMDERAARGERFSEEDRAFHQALYQPLGNTLTVQLLQIFWDVFHGVRYELRGTPPPLPVTAGRHRDILNAIERGDAAGAAAAMAAHFDGIYAWIDEPDPVP